MSRIGKLPIAVPSGVTVTVEPGNHITVKGPRGELKVQVHDELGLEQVDQTLTVSRQDNHRHSRSQHGLARTLINNAIQGVTKGHTKSLDVIGVGYRAQLEGKGLLLNMGYSHPVRIAPVAGITFDVAADEKTRTQRISVSGSDKVLVGQIAADIRKVRRPDPYKGKGIRYTGETVKLKAGKRAAAKK